MPACPDPRAYQQLLLSRTPVPDEEHLLRHLEVCGPCADSVDRLVALLAEKGIVA